MEGTNTPPEVTNVISVAAGRFNTLALRRDGVVFSWGTQGPSPPPGLTNVVALSAGDHHFMARVSEDEPPPVGRPPVEILGFHLTDRGFQVQVHSREGAVYLLESSDSLSGPSWTMVKPLVLGDGTARELGDSSFVQTQRFYRVRRTH